MLRSANFGELVEPRTRGKRYGPLSFRVAAPSVWNNLPRHLRNDDISHEQFTRDLKTFLFTRPILVRGAFENVCLKVCSINGLTYLLTYNLSDKFIMLTYTAVVIRSRTFDSLQIPLGRSGRGAARQPADYQRDAGFPTSRTKLQDDRPNGQGHH